MRQLTTSYPDGEWDPTGAIRQAELRAIERVIRFEVRGLLEAHELHCDGAYLHERAELAWSRMDWTERADFRHWCQWIGYWPGADEYECLPPDEAWVEFVRECTKGTPVFVVHGNAQDRF